MSPEKTPATPGWAPPKMMNAPSPFVRLPPIPPPLARLSPIVTETFVNANRVSFTTVGVVWIVTCSIWKSPASVNEKAPTETVNCATSSAVPTIPSAFVPVISRPKYGPAGRSSTIGSTSPGIVNVS